jgi:hypothetical protein
MKKKKVFEKERAKRDSVLTSESSVHQVVTAPAPLPAINPPGTPLLLPAAAPHAAHRSRLPMLAVARWVVDVIAVCGRVQGVGERVALVTLLISVSGRGSYLVLVLVSDVVDGARRGAGAGRANRTAVGREVVQGHDRVGDVAHAARHVLHLPPLPRVVKHLGEEKNN